MNVPIYKPGHVDVRGLRTSLAPSMLGDGYYQAIDNLRWDTGVLKVRGGVATVSSGAPSTTCLGVWCGALNGTYYVISAWSESSKTTVYSLNLSTGTFTELTVAGSTTRPGWGGTGTTSSGTSAGETRLATATPVTFTVHTTPRRLQGSYVFPPLDFLSIQNGTDWPLLYNPTGITIGAATGPKLTFHKNVRIPPGGNSWLYQGGFTSYFGVATASKATSGKVFTNSTAGRWKVDDSSVAPYNTGTNYCIDLISVSAQSGDYAYVDFGGATAFDGEQFNLIVQPSGTASASAISDWLTGSKVSVSEDNSTYYEIYNPAATDAALTIPPVQTVVDSTRTMVTFSLRNVPTTARALRYVRFTRTATNALSYTLTILMMAGAGSNGGFPGGTEWACAYSNLFSAAESGGIIGTNIGYAYLKNCGGPSVVTSGSGTASGTKLPGNADVLYDYTFTVQNVDNAVVYGGLAGPNSQSYGWPSHVDFYFRTAEGALAGADHLYSGSCQLYDLTLSGSDHVWAALVTTTGTPGDTPKELATFTSLETISSAGARDKADPGTPLPSAYNIAMPRALAVANANRRTFTGAVRDSDGNYLYADLYFSAVGFPFRFQSVQTAEDSGSRLTFDGEKVRKIVMSAAAANGASTVYVITDQTFNALGTAGGFVGSGYDASALSTRVRENSHGTNEPGSVAEHWGVIFYLDQENQLIRFEGGAGRSISRNAVDNLLKGIPASYRGNAKAVFWQDRYYLSYTPSGGTTNARMLGWNETLADWEFNDTLPGNVVGQVMGRAYDSSVVGSGQRLLMFGASDQKVYAYEEGTTEPGSSTGPTISLKTREYQSPDLNLLHIGEVQVMIDAHTATLNVDRYYKPRDSQFRTTIDCSDSESKPKAIKLDTITPTEQTGTGKSEDGWSAYIDFNGALGAGKSLWRIEANIEGLSAGAGER